MIPTVTLKAIVGTSIAHGLHAQAPKDVVHPKLTPALTKPVFQAPEGFSMSEAVAVAFRNEAGKPVHGGFYGITPTGVAKLVLLDEAKGVNTDKDPAWTAFGLNMSLGKFLVRFEDGTREVPWSIVDFGMGKLDAVLRIPTPARLAVRDAYVEHVLPTLGLVEPAIGGPTSPGR